MGQSQLLGKLKERQHSTVKICQIMGISKSTLYNYLAEQGVNARDAA
ncbi:helix-turn-helix domain-containing protein [Methylomonas sp. MED-D]